MKLTSKFALFACILLGLSSVTATPYAKRFERQNDNAANSHKEKTEITIRIKPGVVTVLPASKGYFNHLKIVGTSEFEAKSSGGINIYRMGTNLLITFQDASHPADVAVRELNSDNIYLLALMPQAIPPRSYKIILVPESTEKNKHEPEEKKDGKVEGAQRRVSKVDHILPVYPLSRPEGYEGGYEEFLLDCLSKAALSERIQGASLQNPWTELEIKYQFEPLNGLTLYSVMRWLISDYEIELFLAKNEGTREILLREPYLWQKGVLAVAFVRNFFEKEDDTVKLAPKESVSVLIVKVKGKEL